jgi:hypothetical protein
MISGIVLMLALLQTQTSPAPSTDANALIALLARPVPAQTAFTEVRFARLLRTPLITRGELTYAGARKLSRRVDSPYHETMTLDGDAAIIAREGRESRHFGLDRAPELQALLAGFAALLGGDAALVDQYFTTALRTNGSDWTLTLQPRTAESSGHLRAMIVDGSGNEPRCFALNESNGDGSVMLLGTTAAITLPTVPTPAQLETSCHRVAP